MRLHTRLAAVLLASSAAVAEAGSVANEAFRNALERGDLDKAARLMVPGVDLNTHRSDGKTLLILAAKESDLILVRRLIAAGADVNATTDNGGTALMFAAIRGNLDIQEVLVDAGANINAVGGFHWTALMVAAVKGHVLAVRRLLAHGADPNLGDVYGWSPLMRAVYEERAEVVEALLEQPNLDLNGKNDQGVTALHLAAIKGNEALVRMLLRAGASPRVQDREGRTPALMAVEAGHEELAALLGYRASQ